MLQCLQSIISVTCADGTGIALELENQTVVLTGIVEVESGMERNRNVNRHRNQRSRSNCRSREGLNQRRMTDMNSKSWWLLLLMFAGLAAIVAVERIL